MSVNTERVYILEKEYLYVVILTNLREISIALSSSRSTTL